MLTLQRFWHWHDSEKPSPALARKMLDRNVSFAGRSAVDIAAGFIDCHANGGFLGHRVFIDQALAGHAEALRELSLALCPALTRMREQVQGAGVTVPPRLRGGGGVGGVGSPAEPAATGTNGGGSGGFAGPLRVGNVRRVTPIVIEKVNRRLAEIDAAGNEAADANSYAMTAACQMHSGYFYAGCLMCQQARVRALNAERLAAQRRGLRDSDL